MQAYQKFDRTQMVCKTFIHRFDSDRRLHSFNTLTPISGIFV